MRSIRWIITAVACGTFAWCFILISVTRPDVLPTLASLLAGCFLLELLMLLRSQRKAKATAAHDSDVSLRAHATPEVRHRAGVEEGAG
ncbi:hypothetical protein [Falsiroseomonas sp. HW251]|uniref:hypothetical protein n=1 Tax=Falsiroseomonas sp. HW251 TaxID=3390998 RepID=UPI003D31EFBB